MPCGPEILFEYTDLDAKATARRVGSLRATFVSSDNSENNDSDDAANDITPDDRATSATARNDFGYEVYDLGIGQSMNLTDTLSLHLCGIGRYTEIDEHFDVTYTGGDFQVPYRAFETSAYHGGGILVGGELRWLLHNKVSLDFGSNVGTMLGEMTTRAFFPDDEPGVPTDVRFDDTRMTPVLESSVGISINHRLGRRVVTLAGGYDMVHWFNIGDSRNFTDSHIEGKNIHLINDLSLDGAYVRLSVNH